MAMLGEDGISMRSMGQNGWGFGKKVRRGWGEFSTHNKLMVSDDLKLSFAMTYGAWTKPSR
jgi:hypothetical protein